MHITDIIADLPKQQKPTLADTGRHKSIDSLGDARKVAIRNKTKNLFRVLVEKVCDMVARSEMMRASFTHKELSELYVESKQLRISDLTILSSPTSPWVVYIGFSVEDPYIPTNTEDAFDLKTEIKSTHLCSIVDIASYLNSKSPGFVEKTSFSSFMKVYKYIVYTMTYFQQNATSFIHIDDASLLAERLDDVDKAMASGDMARIYEALPSDYIQAAYGSLKLPNEIFLKENISVYTGSRWTMKELTTSIDEFKYPEMDFKKIVNSVYTLFALLLRTQDICTLDTETTGLDVLSVDIVSVGLAFDTHLGFYLSLDHKRPKSRKLHIGEKGLIRKASSQAYLELKREGLIEDASSALFMMDTFGDNDKNISIGDFRSLIMPSLLKKKLIYHNAKYDYSVLYHHTGVRFPIYYDTMLAHYVARPGYDDRVLDKRGLQFVAVKELGITPWKSDITKCQAEHKDLVAAYNARDCCYTQAISYTILPDLSRIHKLFFDIEMPFIEILAHAEISGICVDKDILQSIEADLNSKMEQTVEEFKLLSENPEFNINSGAHLSNLFFEKMKIQPIRKCKKCTKINQGDSDVCPYCGGASPIKRMTGAGKPSLDKVALEDFGRIGIKPVKDLLDYRAFKKLTSSYTNLWEKAHPFDGNIHPSYHQTSTATGRLSCSNPNFQQLPKKAAKYIREAIKPRPGYCLVGADYSGQEIRIMAAYSGDPKLIKAYNPCYHCKHNDGGKGEYSKFGKCEYETHEDPNSECNVVDIHSYVTAQVYKDIVDVPVTQIKDHPVWDAYRSRCKAVTFKLAYGGGAYSLAEEFNIPFEEAKEIVDKYFETFPGIKRYINDCQLFVDTHGFIEDMVGRARRFKYAGWKIQEHNDTYYETWFDRKTGLKKAKFDYGREVSGDLRSGTNHPIQGLAASMTKIGAIELYRAIQAEGLDAEIIEFIHDEVLLSVRKDAVTIQRVGQLVRECMINKINMPAYCLKDHPLKWRWPPYLEMDVDLKVGNSYGKMTSVKEYLASMN